MYLWWTNENTGHERSTCSDSNKEGVEITCLKRTISRSLHQTTKEKGSPNCDKVVALLTVCISTTKYSHDTCHVLTLCFRIVIMFSTYADPTVNIACTLSLTMVFE